MSENETAPNKKSDGKNSSSFRGLLRGYNFLLACFHAVGAILVYNFADSYILPVQFELFDPDITEISSFSIDLSQLVILYLVVSAVSHLLISVIWYTVYKSSLREGKNYFRWWEYSISSTLMVVALLMIVGIESSTILFLCGLLNIAMNFFGLAMEAINPITEDEQPVTWSPFVAGCICALPPWVIMFFLTSVDSISNLIFNETGVFLMIVITLFCFLAFPYVMWRFYSGPLESDRYLRTEYRYAWLSLICKFTLSAFIFFLFLQ